MRINRTRKSRFLGRGYRAMGMVLDFVVDGIYCTDQGVDLVAEWGKLRLEPNQPPVNFETMGDSIPI